MKHPFIIMLIPYIIGIFSLEYIHISTYYLLITVVIATWFLLISFLTGKNYIVFLVTTMVLIGGLRLNKSSEDSILLKYENISLDFQASIEEILSKEDGYSRFIVTIQKFKHDKEDYIIKEKSIIKVSGNIDLKLKDIIQFASKIEVPKRDKNPGSFNYNRYLKSENIYVLLPVKSSSIKILSRRNTKFLEKISIAFERKIISVTNEYLNNRYAGIISSILLGDTDYLEDNIANTFRNLGLSHIFAVSGLHIGIIVVFIFFILKILKLRKEISVLITILIIWTYGYLIGYPTSVLRASFMFSILLISTILHRRYNGVNVISLIALIILLYNPYLLFSLGFLLTFITTLSLLVLTNILRYNFFKGYKILGKYLSPVIAVQIGITPIIILYFNRINVFTLLLNLIVIPIISLVVIFSVLLILLSFISIKLTYVISKLLIIKLYLIDILTNSFYNFPYGNINVKSLEIDEIILYYIIVLLYFNIINLNIFTYNIKKIVFLYLVIIVLLNVTLETLDNSVYVDFIDVGQGDSFLIRYKNKNFLIDAGGSPFGSVDVGKEIVLNYIRKLGIRKLDGIFVSHFHEDHSNGVLSLLGRIKINNVFIGYENENSDIYNQLIDLSKNYDINVVNLNNNDEIIIGSNLNIKVMHPNKKTFLGGNENDYSLVLLLKAHNKSILFTGDIESSGESEIMSSNKTLNVDILKVSHHGSNTSSSKDFIDFIDPEYGVISVGKNLFGHPNKDVLNRFIKKDVAIYRTDNSGLISVVLDENNITIKEHINDKYKLNDIIYNYSIDIITFMIFVLILYFIIVVNYKGKLKDLDCFRRNNCGL